MPLRHELSPEEAALALAKARIAAGLAVDDGTPTGKAAAAALAAMHASVAGATPEQVRLAKGVAAAKAAEADAARRAASAPIPAGGLASHPAVAAMMRDVKLPPRLADLEHADTDEDDAAGAAQEEDDDVPDDEFESMLDMAADGGTNMSFSSTLYPDQRLDAHAAASSGGPSASAAAAGAPSAAFGLSESGMFDDEDEEDEEDADALEAKPGDSFFVAARTDEDWSCAEVYCYVRDDATLYVHHDIALPAMPMALAWSDCPPARSSDDLGVPLASAPVGSYLAVGSMRPGIEVWNLDVTDPLEPSLVLGGSAEEQLPHQRAAGATASSAASRAGLAPGSHTEAVLSLCWNRVHRQLLASGSADHSVKLWDMRRGAPVHSWGHHSALVQSVAWHPSTGAESSVLASGSADGTVAVIDARTATGAVLRMPAGAEVEAVAWSPHASSALYVTTQAGTLLALDVRRPAAPVATVQACKGECASLSVAPRLPGIVATGGSDGVARLWDLSGSVARSVGSKAMAVGPLFSAQWLPHSDGILAAAGGNGLVAIWDIPNDDARVAAELKARLVAAEAAPSLAVRLRPDGQPLTGTAGSASGSANGSAGAAAPVRSLAATASSSSSSSSAGGAAAGGAAAETSAALAEARRQAVAVEVARAQAARAGLAAGAAGSSGFEAAMAAAAGGASSGKARKGDKARKGKVVRKKKGK